MNKFECAGCGFNCCKNLIIPLAGVHHVGLCLMPQEVPLFPAGTVEPMWSVGTKGHSRPRPRVILYQLNRDTCPFLDPKKFRCTIYKKRPLVCIGHPLSINLAGATVDNRCPTAHPLINSKVKVTDAFPKEYVDANMKFHNYMAKEFGGRGKYEAVKLFDLKTRTWNNITEELATRFIEEGVKE